MARRFITLYLIIVAVLVELQVKQWPIYSGASCWKIWERKNRGTKTAGYYVIKNNSVPAILIELGFISGSSDFSRLTSENFQKKAAKSLYTGIVKMFSLYQTGR